MEFKFALGAEVISTITGFKGINVSNSVHINGCSRCYVQPKIRKDNKVPDGLWHDEPELKLVKKSKKEAAPLKTGGFSSTIK